MAELASSTTFVNVRRPSLVITANFQLSDVHRQRLVLTAESDAVQQRRKWVAHWAVRKESTSSLLQQLLTRVIMQLEYSHQLKSRNAFTVNLIMFLFYIKSKTISFLYQATTFKLFKEMLLMVTNMMTKKRLVIRLASTVEVASFKTCVNVPKLIEDPNANTPSTVAQWKIRALMVDSDAQDHLLKWLAR